MSTRKKTAWLLGGLMLAGLALRLSRLAWQPLWWDEGYSVYFATEPLARMLWLTARDIHPPLYYALLHGWIALFHSADPMVLRAFSVITGALTLLVMGWVAWLLFVRDDGGAAESGEGAESRRESRGGAKNTRVVVIAVLLLAVSPMHIYYSQEVRMYGLALLLSLASTGFLWRLVSQAAPPAPQPWGERSAGQAQPPPGLEAGGPTASSPAPQPWGERSAGQAQPPPGLGAGGPTASSPRIGGQGADGILYALTGALALYTLYYSALLLFAHFVWAAWRFRRNLRGLPPLVWADVAIAAAYLPWVIYAAPKLAPYVSNKVASDKDEPLGALAYAWRHLHAFLAGHVTPAWSWLAFAGLAGLIGVAILIIVLILSIRKQNERRVDASNAQNSLRENSPFTALWFLLLLPLTIGFLLNLRLPFFPVGGERTMLLVLPYFLLLLAAGIDRVWSVAHLGKIALAALLVSAAAGIATFYTTPRYVERDYRPLIGQVVQQGSDSDTFFAIFPWQVGYWRAYAPADFRANHGPDAVLAGEGILAWGPDIAAELDAALDRGVVWFPAPLSFGSALPGEIEAHLAAQGFNLVNRWYSRTTRLSAWAAQGEESGEAQAIDADFGPARLVRAGVAPLNAASDNVPIHIVLTWIKEKSDLDPNDLYVSLRLLDDDDHAWASRDYAPLGGLAASKDESAEPGALTDRAGLIIPVGLPPGAYTLAVGVGRAADQALLRPDTVSDDAASLQPVAVIQVGQPATPPPVERLPIQFPLSKPLADEGLTLLGHAGATDGETILAGTELGVTLFFQNRNDSPPPRQIYLSLLDKNGAGVAGWEGWPLPAYPTETWPQDALVQVPAAFFLSATLPSGEYKLIAGLLDPASGEKSPPATLGAVQVQQRIGEFEAPAIQRPLTPPVLFGDHAELIGYDLVRQGRTLAVTLYWRAQQPLLPPHHIFVHLDAADGTTVAQDDGPPQTADGPAPTGSWLPGEYISTHHVIALPDGQGWNQGEYTLRVGLYNPDGNIRLPASVDGEPHGDSAELRVP